MKVSEINTNFGNPRKISKEGKAKLKKSLEEFGDFGIFIIDENNSVIAGNQRLAILKEMDENIEVDCKRLVGYTDSEKNISILKIINMQESGILIY